MPVLVHGIHVSAAGKRDRRGWPGKPGRDEENQGAETELRLRAVVAFDDHEVAVGMRRAHRDQPR